MVLNRITSREVLTELSIRPVPYRRIVCRHDAWSLVQHVVCLEFRLCYLSALHSVEQEKTVSGSALVPTCISSVVSAEYSFLSEIEVQVRLRAIVDKI